MSLCWKLKKKDKEYLKKGFFEIVLVAGQAEKQKYIFN